MVSLWFKDIPARKARKENAVRCGAVRCVRALVLRWGGGYIYVLACACVNSWESVVVNEWVGECGCAGRRVGERVGERVSVRGRGCVGGFRCRCVTD